MGVEGTCRSGNRGGCPLLSTPIYSRTPSLHLLSFFRPLVFSFAPSCLSSGRKASETGQTGQKLNYICLIWCFLGNFGDDKRQNLNLFLKCRKEDKCGGGRLPAFWRVHWLQGCRTFRGFRTCRMPAVVLWWCVPCLLVAFLLYACRVACKCGSISRFKGVFRGF